MKPFARSERVGGQIQKLISELLQKTINDPRLEMATITTVRLTSDLRMARVYFTVTGGPENRSEATRGFECARGYIKRTLAPQLGLRYMPDLKFFYDETFEYGTHINQVLKSLNLDDEIDPDASEVV
jgi:ribosome-binding factor A